MASHPQRQQMWTEGSHLLPEQKGFSDPTTAPWHNTLPTDSDIKDKHAPHPCFGRLSDVPPHKPTLLQKLSDTWTFELVGLAISAASLGAIVYVLRRYDGHQIPDWAGLSFNTLISILAVIAKMAALYGATNAVSQLKWAWFAETGKHLTDYKTFDGASRGMTGAAMLALSLKGRNAAVIGAAAIIIGVAVGPFAQQVVRFYDAGLIDTSRTAWLARAETVDSLGPKQDSWLWSLDPALKANAITSLFLPTQEVLTEPRFSCPTGNCTYPSFTTLGFCEKCIDLTSQLKRSCVPIDNSTENSHKRCTVSFPGGTNSLRLYYLDHPQAPGSSTYMVLNTTSPENSIALQNTTWPSRIYQSIRAAIPPYNLGGSRTPDLDANGTTLSGLHLLRSDTQFIATECVLTPCVRHLEASVARNLYTETILSTFAEYEEPGANEPLILSPPETPLKNYTLHAKFLEAIFVSTISGNAFDPLGGALVGKVETHDSNQAMLVTDLPPPGHFSQPNDALQSIFYTDFENSTSTCPTPNDTVRCAFRVLAMGLTKFVRDAGILRNGTDVRGGVVKGEVMMTATFIRVEWPWFALPVAVWVLSVVVVGVAMGKSRGSGLPLWRDSVLPLVLAQGGRGSGGEVMEGALAKKAEGVEVSLVEKEGRLRVVFRGYN